MIEEMTERALQVLADAICREGEAVYTVSRARENRSARIEARVFQFQEWYWVAVGESGPEVSGPYENLEATLYSEAGVLTSFSLDGVTIESSEMTAEEIVPLLTVKSETAASPIVINGQPWSSVRGNLRRTSGKEAAVSPEKGSPRPTAYTQTPVRPHFADTDQALSALCSLIAERGTDIYSIDNDYLIQVHSYAGLYWVTDLEGGSCCAYRSLDEALGEGGPFFNIPWGGVEINSAELSVDEVVKRLIIDCEGGETLTINGQEFSIADGKAEPSSQG
jgi:hypothetical protein